MNTRFDFVAVFCVCLCHFFLSTPAHAASYSFGVLENGEWVTKFGEVPSPPAHYTTPTTDHILNRKDKQYLCSLVNLADSNCTDVRFSNGASGLNGQAGITRFILNVSMVYKGKECSGAVWKTLQSDGSWILSSPTALFGFPYTCDIP